MIGPDEIVPETTLDVESPPRSRMAVYVLLTMVFLVLGGGGLFGWWMFRVTEQRLSDEAEADYKKPNYVAAGSKFKQLQEQFPSSESVPRYRLMEELCAS